MINTCDVAQAPTATWSVDRLGSSLQHLIGFLNELHANKVDLYLHQQGIDTTTPAGRSMFSMPGVFGEFERSMIQERVRAGLKRAVAQGKVLGRPMVNGDIQKKVLALRAKGQGIIKIAKSVGIGVGTVARMVA
jgi:DNA invertase Pin-like site-specific DNA recombinase